MDLLRKLLKAAAILLIAVPIWGQDFYDIESINTLEIEFVESNWDALLDSLVEVGNEDRLMGQAFINGDAYDSVGVRYKGNSSYNPNQIKNPLNIKLDYLIDGQEHQGYGTLRLANVYKDPSFVRETLGYEIAGNYLPVSKANYIKVYINGTYLGLYTSVQDVDKSFLKEAFYSKNNPFFKGDLINESPQSQVTVWGYFGDDSTTYQNYYELKSDQGWDQLVNFLDVLNNNPANVEDVLNVDRHLWMLAFDNLLVNLDSPINFAHNFYLYQDDNGHFNPIIWDLNESFGGFTNLIGGMPLNTGDLQQLSPFLNLDNSSYPIISKILTDPTYKKMYVAHMKTMMSEIFTSGYYKTRALELQSIIDTEVQNDLNKFYTYSNFIDNVDATVGGQTGGPPGPSQSGVIGLTELMEARVNYLNGLAEFQAAAPEISEISSVPEHPAANTTVTITARVDDGQSVQFCYRSAPTAAFNKLEMYDDGNHGDGNSGDGVYGLSLPVSNSDMEYYIYAENSDAASFMPPRAAYEFYSLPVSGDVVINEFMAKNSSTISDENGEFDDWIELYNTTDAPIALAGYFLSDDGGDLAQWTFPDTSIGAHDYLLIWADKDAAQGPMHASFKLSASGETLYLSSPDTTLLSSIPFGTQDSLKSYGRFPNGYGAFMLMQPTPAAENTYDATALPDEPGETLPEEYALAQNYPNPFNPSTVIEFTIPKSSPVTLTIFNATGQKIKTLVKQTMARGTHAITFQAQDLASGIYFYHLQAGNFSQTRRMLLLK